MALILLVWLLVRVGISRKAGSIRRKRELQLMLVFICIVVVVRFPFRINWGTFCYSSGLSGKTCHFDQCYWKYRHIPAPWDRLPFYDRVTDIDDLILNSVGFLMGYGLHLLVKKCRKKRKCEILSS